VRAGDGADTPVFGKEREEGRRRIKQAREQNKPRREKI